MALRTVKVPPLAHRLLMARAAKNKVTAGAMLLRLLEDDSVTVPLEPVQRQRWEAAAAEYGVSLPQFILLRVEAMFGNLGAPAAPYDANGVELPDTVHRPCCPPEPHTHVLGEAL